MQFLLAFRVLQQHTSLITAVAVVRARFHRFLRQRASAPSIRGFEKCPCKIGQGLPCRARVPHWQVSCIVASSASLGRVGVDGSCDPSGCRVAAGPHSCEAGRKFFGKHFPRPGGAGGCFGRVGRDPVATGVGNKWDVCWVGGVPGWWLEPFCSLGVSRCNAGC